MTPELNKGAYVSVTLTDLAKIYRWDTICEFKEKEGVTVIWEKSEANELNFQYDFIAAWITLKMYSSLMVIGLTAAFQQALTIHNISCNVVAGYFHDHIFVDRNNTERAVTVLKNLS